MMPIRQQCGTLKALASSRADPSRDVVAGESKGSGNGQNREMIRRDGMQQTSRRLDAGHARAEPDHDDHCDTSSPFCARRTQEEGKAKGHGGQCIAEVVNQIREEGDAAARDEDPGLHRGGRAQDRKGAGDGADSLA